MVSFKAVLLVAVLYTVASSVCGFRPGGNPLLPDTGTATHGGVDPRILNLPSVPTHDPATGPVNTGGTTGGGTTGGGATGGGATGGGSSGGGTTGGGNHALPRGPIRPGGK